MRQLLIKRAAAACEQMASRREAQTKSENFHRCLSVGVGLSTWRYTRRLLTMLMNKLASLLSFGFLAATLLVLSGGCAGEAQVAQPATPIGHEAAQPAAEAISVPTVPPVTYTPPAPPPTPAATAVPTATPATAAEDTAVPPFFYRAADPCGLLLPLLSTYDEPLVSSLSADAAAVQPVMALLPETAQPALQRLLDAPQTVGLAAYRVGDEANGVYLNAGAPMPLASVVKVLHLVAYAEAAAAGEINPTETVTVADLDRFYLPTLDLRAHSEALDDLEDGGLIFGQPAQLLLDGVARMMIEYSSNAATDYLHMRLGQEAIEETAQLLDLGSQTAPCPFVGQFLAMANHTRPQIDGRTAVLGYVEDPARYGDEVVQLTAAFSEDAAFHDEAIAWRTSTRRPRGSTQRLFSEQLNAQGSAADYAALMARLALNGLSSGESSFMVRRHLEWPMRFYDNQELFSNLGYKGGSLPGILTTVYYAYPFGETTPLVVALFYRDLPGATYQSWRRTQAHDEFARWLLYEPQAIPALRTLLPQEP